MIRSGLNVIARLAGRLNAAAQLPSDVSHIVEVRSLTQDDLAIVSRELNPARDLGTHTTRLGLQSEGKLEYLIAWIDGAPVGHGMIYWDGPTGPPKQFLSEVRPYVEDLWVRRELRSRGIGARIIAEMAMTAAARRCQSIGLSVGINNRGAIRLYERLGFVKVRVPNFTLSGIVASNSGSREFWSEECIYMVKNLDFGQVQEF